MPKFLDRLHRWAHDRRKVNLPVEHDRRSNGGRQKAADERLHNAIDELERTVRMKREDFIKCAAHNTPHSANDIQQEVQFHTFRAICDSKLDAGAHRLCRHPKHEAANTGIAKCEEQLCPWMLGTAKSVA